MGRIIVSHERSSKTELENSSVDSWLLHCKKQSLPLCLVLYLELIISYDWSGYNHRMAEVERNLWGSSGPISAQAETPTAGCPGMFRQLLSISKEIHIISFSVMPWEFLGLTFYCDVGFVLLYNCIHILQHSKHFDNYCFFFVLKEQIVFIKY